MLKVFFHDLFQTTSPLKILSRLFFNLLLFLFFAAAIYAYKYFILQEPTAISFDIVLFLISYVISFFSNYNPQRILYDAAVRKSRFYRFCFLVLNYLISWASILYFSSIFIASENLHLFFLRYFLIFSSLIVKFCFERHFLVKLAILILTSCVVVLSTNLIILYIVSFLFLVLYFIFQNKCFDEYRSSLITTDIIDKTYQKNINTTSMITEWLFIIRNKKGLLILSFMLSFAMLGFFCFLQNNNPDILSNLDDFRLLLLISCVSGSFSIILGPYMMNWFYFYSNDFLSKKWSIKSIIKGKINLMLVISFLLFLISIPFSCFLHIDFNVMLYFFIMNISLVIFVSLLIGIYEISKIDSSKSPRLKVEKGSAISTYIPWLCEAIPVIIFKIINKIASPFWAVIFAIMSFAVLYFVREKIIDKYVSLISLKIGSKTEGII